MITTTKGERFVTQLPQAITEAFHLDNGSKMSLFREWPKVSMHH